MIHENKLYLLLIIVISVAMLLSACQTPPNVPSEPDDSTSESGTASPAYKHDNERYPLTAGLATESNEEPWTAPDYVPTDGEVFVTAYYYLFAVSVE